MIRPKAIVSNLIVENNTTHIAGQAFKGNTNIVGQVELPISLVSLGSECFYGCSGITSLTNNSQNLTVVEQYAFAYASNLGGDITMPDTLTGIGRQGFRGIAAASITFHSSTPPAIASEVFYDTTLLIYVPAASVDVYKAATNWSALASRIFAIPE